METKTLKKSKIKEINTRVKMNNKNNKLVINTISPGFNYKNKKGEIVTPKVSVLL